MYAIVQTVIIALIVAFCAVQMLRRLMPKLSRELQVKGADALTRADLPPVVQAIGQTLKPAEAADSGCGSGCGSCKGCSLSELKKG
ncbi:DUF6587 family protein [Asticcacaulis sp. 201]|uniref:DUF6587 family protein n=1 Tax=Asticcacaulis sp. 201 TaxID=3028787 RepID=UPI0029161F0F|nr:DUF6587 family protein [Asticcacaulis sp. 201]MDV6332185.1 DUF6587 family protein [Asticcacaulis sp. 201]